MLTTGNLKTVWLLLFVALGHIEPATAAPADYPNKRIQIIVPWSPGTAVDVVARFFAAELTTDLGMPVTVENRPGANSNIGTEFVARSPADGYRVLVTGSSFFINQALMKDVRFDVQRDFRPVARLAAQQIVMVVPVSSPFLTLREFLEFARKNPGKLNYGSSGSGSATHLAGSLFSRMAEVDLRHIPYSSSSQLTVDTISGAISSSFQSLPAVTSLVEENKLRALGVSGTSRSARLRNVPTVAEGGVPGYVTSSWTGAFVRADTPDQIVDKLAGAMLRVSAKPAYADLLLRQGLDRDVVGPEWSKAIPAELHHWAELVAKSGAKAD